jgi:two-component system, NtrC family, sensor kinase
MKLAVKLVLTVVLGIAMILLVDGYVSFKRQRALFEDDMHHDVAVLGRTMRTLVTDVWRANGRERAWRLIEDANDVEPSMDIGWVWLDAPGGDPCAPRASGGALDPAVRGLETSFTQADKQGRVYYYSYFPVPIDGQRPGAIEIREPLSDLEKLTRRALIRVLGLTVALVFLGSCAALPLGVRLIGRPLDHVVQKMRRIGAGDFSDPLILSGHGELDELAAGLNTMCAQLQEAWDKVRRETEARIAALEQLRHDDRLKTVGRLASGIAHELGTPLNVISGYAGMIAGGNLSSQETVESAQIIKVQSERITSIVRQLLDFARRRPGEKMTVDLQQLIRQTLDLVRPLAQKQNVRLIQVEDEATVATKADAEQIKQVLLNLITNAVQAMPGGGEVEVVAGPTTGCPPAGHTDPGGQYVCISVRDSGEGIPEENLSRIFEPFFTTKGPGKGTGLGLSVAEGIVREHGGWITVESTRGKGSCFCVCLPKEGPTCRDES